MARKIPGFIKRRVIQRPDAFRTIAWLDDETLNELLASLDKQGREQAESALGRAHDFPQHVLDALVSHIAVLNELGTILAVNAAWNSFAAANGLDKERCGPGVNYLDP